MVKKLPIDVSTWGSPNLEYVNGALIIYAPDKKSHKEILDLLVKARNKFKLKTTIQTTSLLAIRSDDLAWTESLVRRLNKPQLMLLKLIAEDV